MLTYSNLLTFTAVIILKWFLDIWKICGTLLAEVALSVHSYMYMYQKCLVRLYRLVMALWADELPPLSVRPYAWNTYCCATKVVSFVPRVSY
jgi:hypothetical protein